MPTIDKIVKPEPKHTPEEWKMSPEGNIYINRFPFKLEIAKRTSDFNIKESEANFQLILTSPQLLREHMTDIPILEGCISLIKKGREDLAISHIKTILESKSKVINKAIN